MRRRFEAAYNKARSMGDAQHRMQSVLRQRRQAQRAMQRSAAEPEGGEMSADFETCPVGTLARLRRVDEAAAKVIKAMGFAALGSTLSTQHHQS